MLLLSIVLAAAGPLEMTWQGRVLDNAGVPLNTPNSTIELALYPQASGGSVAWQDTFTSAVQDGFVSVRLGTGAALPQSLFAAGDLWVEVRVGGVVTGPRQHLVSVPESAVARGVRIEGAPPSGTCSGSAGAVVWDTSLQKLRLCDGSNWRAVAAPLLDTTPDAVSFTSVTVAPSTLATSDIRQITGVEVGVAASISTANAPQFRVCDDATCATVVTDWTASTTTVAPGDWVQMRLAAASTASTGRTATLTLAGAPTTWSVTSTGAPQPYSVLTWNNMGSGQTININWSLPSYCTPSGGSRNSPGDTVVTNVTCTQRPEWVRVNSGTCTGGNCWISLHTGSNAVWYQDRIFICGYSTNQLTFEFGSTTLDCGGQMGVNINNRTMTVPPT
jgi:hypothetical protein